MSLCVVAHFCPSATSNRIKWRSPDVRLGRGGEPRRIFNHGNHRMIHEVSIPAALIAGLISFLSPCVLPLVPPYLIYLTGATIEHVANDETVAASRRAVMSSAAMFVLGFSTVFVALGASASLVGGLIHAWSAQLAIVAGIVIILMGLHFLGLTRIGLLMREGRSRSAGPRASARFSRPSFRSPPPRRR
jgi:cytochrome c biogenesis protein CcdA